MQIIKFPLDFPKILIPGTERSQICFRLHLVIFGQFQNEFWSINRNVQTPFKLELRARFVGVCIRFFGRKLFRKGLKNDQILAPDPHF